MNIKKIFLIIGLFLAIVALVNYATNKPYNSVSPATTSLGIDIEKRNANSYKLNLEQIKTDCRIFHQLLQSALMYRYQTNNMVSYEDVTKKTIATATEQLGAKNINAEFLISFAKLASAYGSELSSEGMASNLAQGTEGKEAKCVAGENIFLNADGYYYKGKYAAIINWDNTNETNFVINY